MKLLTSVIIGISLSLTSYAGDVTVSWNSKHTASSGTAYVLSSRSDVNSNGYPVFGAQFGTASTVRFTPANLGGLNRADGAQKLNILSSSQVTAVNSTIGGITISVTNSSYPFMWSVSSGSLNNDGYWWRSSYGTTNACGDNSPIQFGTSNSSYFGDQPGTKPVCVQLTKGTSTNKQYVLSNCSCITRDDSEDSI